MAYYIPYSNKSDAINKNKENSKTYCSLNGEWNFKYFDIPLDIPDDINCINFNNAIDVPSYWGVMDTDKFSIRILIIRLNMTCRIL